ncbi:MAG: MFS transporter [Anaerolineales bacterium]|nr:MFS transporter [Anaerolineales bacterium]
MKISSKNFFTISESEAVHPEVKKNFKRNFFANLMDACFWFFGDSFAAAYTILPVFISTLTDSPILIGLIPALDGAGWFLPQLFMARTLEGRSRRMPLVRIFGLFDRIPFLFLAAGTFFIPQLDKRIALILILVIYAVKTFSSGLVALPWQELIATVIPVSHRGRYWGYSLILGKLMGLGGAAISGILLVSIVYPYNYATMFLIGFFAVSISYSFLIRNIEPEIPRQNPPEYINLLTRIKGVFEVDKNFLIYLINRSFIFLASMSLAFITVYGIRKFDLPIAQSATFTAIMLISEIIGYGIWGTLGDRKGYKKVIETSNFILIIGISGLLWVNTLWALYLVFGLISFANSGEMISDQNFAMEFGSEEDRPTYIGMSKTLTGPFFLLAPLIGGSIVQFWGFKSMFLTAMILSIISFSIIKFLVKDPRNTNNPDEHE